MFGFNSGEEGLYQLTSGRGSIRTGFLVESRIKWRGARDIPEGETFRVRVSWVVLLSNHGSSMISYRKLPGIK